MPTTVRMDPPNWVKARADCNLAMTFDALFSVARRDVEEANNIEALTKGRFSYAVQQEDGGTEPAFSVTRNMNGCPVDTVVFQQFDHVIQVSRTKGDGFSVTARWNSAGCRCELFVQDVRNEIWEISKGALEPLFFAPSP